MNFKINNKMNLNYNFAIDQSYNNLNYNEITTNLDFDPPSSKAPETQQSLFIKALKENWTNEEFSIKLDKLTNNQIA